MMHAVFICMFSLARYRKYSLEGSGNGGSDGSSKSNIAKHGLSLAGDY